MALITVPDFLRLQMETAQLTLERTDFQMRSAYTNQRQVLAWHSGHMWRLSCRVPNLYEPNSGLFRSFLAKMRGRVNTARLPVPGYRGPSNGYSGAVGIVNGAGQTGYSLITNGWAASQTVLPEGSYITVNDELKMVTAPAVTDGGGAVTISFEPAIRYSPLNNAPITITDPYILMSLSEPNGASWSLRSPSFHAFELEFEEAVDLPA